MVLYYVKLVISLGKPTDLKQFATDQKPIYITNDGLNGAKPGDIVQVLTTPKDKNLTGKVIQIIAKGAFREGTKGSSAKVANSLLITLTSKGSSRPIPWDKVIVLDNGTGNVKVGFAADTKPRAVFPSVVGRPMGIPGLQQSTKSLFVGEEALSRVRSHIQLTNTFLERIVTVKLPT